MIMPRLLDGSMHEVRRLHPLALSLNEELHALSYASMTLPPGEEIAFHDWVEVFTLSGSAGIYRANKLDTDTATGCQTVKLEHGICALADAIANVESEDLTGTVSQVLTRILSYQTVQAGGADLWAVGTVEPTDNNVTITLNYNSSMSLLTSLLDQLNECWPEYNQTQLPWTVSVRQKGSTPTAEGRIGRNVESAKISYDDRDMANYIYCPKVTGGYMSDATSIATYGRREGYCKVDDGATPQQAADICTRYLAKRKDPAVSVSVSMADLSAVTGESLDRIRCGKLYRLALPKYGVTVDETVAAISWGDLVRKPAEAKVSLANHAADLVLNIKKLGKGGGGGKQQNEIDKAVKRFTTSITQTDEYIRLIATETDVQTAQTLGQSLFQITSHDITSVVTQAGVSTDDTFDPAQSYAAGATVVYGGALYRFTAAHTGAWTGTDVTQITLQSQISQNAQDIVLAVGDISQLRIDVDGITIQGDVITIKGNQINMGDYVTMTAFRATTGLIDDLRVGDARFTAIDAGDISCDSIETDAVTVNGENPMKAIKSFGTASESGGQITIPTTCLDYTSGPSINFNIAATSYYQQGVSAADTAGYNRGVDEFHHATVYLASPNDGIYLTKYGKEQLYTWDGDTTHTPTPVGSGARWWYYNTLVEVSTGTYAPYTTNTSTYYTRS